MANQTVTTNKTLINPDSTTKDLIVTLDDESISKERKMKRDKYEL